MKQRLHYFDILKGIAIFMVVMGHVLTMCVREIDRATLFKFIGEIHMPLFFFISGWFTFRLAADGRISTPHLGKRALQLLVPMVAVSSLWIWYFPHSGLQSPLVSTFSGLWSNAWKNGYWFTLVLFEIMLLYTAMCPVLSRCRTATASLAATVAAWIILKLIFSGISAFAGEEFLNATSLILALQFFPIFMVGAIASRHSDGFNRLCESGGAFTVSLIAGAFLLYFISWYWEFPLLTGWTYGTVVICIARILFHICLAIVAIAVIRPWSGRVYGADSAELTSQRRWADMWRLLGRKSLAIYLLHYFLLFPLGACRDALLSMNLGFTPLLVFSGAVAACVITIVLGINAIIERSPLLALLLTGTVAKPAKSQVERA